MNTEAPDIASWLETPLGQALLEMEIEQLERAVQQFFGFHMLQIGEWGPLEELRANAMARQVALVSARAGPHVQVLSEASRLAVASDSIDGVILPHTLEFDSEPHQVLREAERILTGEGKIAILGFNPKSFWGARRAFGRRRYLPGLRHMISRKRICDWLTLLGFELLDARCYFYRPPINHRAILERSSGYEKFAARLNGLGSGAYMVTAKKCVYSPIPPRAVRTRKKATIVGGLVEPTRRNGQ